jgi:hypothetical protein
MSDIRASHIGAEYEPDHRNPALVIRDEHGVLRPVTKITRLNGGVVRGNLKGYEEVLLLEIDHA